MISHVYNFFLFSFPIGIYLREYILLLWVKGRIILNDLNLTVSSLRPKITMLRLKIWKHIKQMVFKELYCDNHIVILYCDILWIILWYSICILIWISHTYIHTGPTYINNKKIFKWLCLILENLPFYLSMTSKNFSLSSPEFHTLKNTSVIVKIELITSSRFP